MECKNKLIKIILIVCIFAGGAYSFNHLSFLSKANPANVLEAIQSFNQSSSNFQQGFRGPSAGQRPPFEGQRGPGGHSRGANQGFNSFGNLLAFLGVFASTITATYVVDQLLRNRKVMR
ncbi:MAG: hypothetical protein ABFD18_01055 [Syntrophomonas sp.]